MIVLLLALQAAPPPDIELHATLQARSVTIEKRGEARLEVHASPDAGSLVKVEAPKAEGRTTLRDVRVAVDAEARIGKEVATPATEPPPPR